MADWIASDERHFPGVDHLAAVDMSAARQRARAAVSALGLRRGLRPSSSRTDRRDIDAAPVRSGRPAGAGQDGLFLGLPTQATSDAVFSRVLRWLRTFDDPPQPGLLHGKRALNSEWTALQRTTSYAGVDR